MNHLPILPFLIPLAATVVTLWLANRGTEAVRIASLASVLAVGLVATLLVMGAVDGTTSVYRLGNWPAPFGIVFVVDRLSAAMVAVTTAVALPALLFASGGTDTLGRHFHPLFQMQIAGLNGAFLTGDLFNLFVCFEVLLIASYGLLAHGLGAARARAGLHYVVLNLTGSALFLVALGLIYGTLGTLNLADVAGRLTQVPEQDQALVRTAMMLLIVVFALKAALLPLSFWLPRAYPAATPAVAALFAVMTKVGIYAILRVTTIGFAGAPITADLVTPWLAWFALGTIALGTIGALAAPRVSVIAANAVLISSGTLLTAIAFGGERPIQAAIFYLPHTTLATGALFLLAGWIGRARGELGDRLERGTRIAELRWIGGVFALLAITIAGLPPLSGFLGKLMLMSAAPVTMTGYVLWAGLILSSFAVTLAFARAASILFWEPAGDAECPITPTPRLHRSERLGLALAFLLVPAVVVFAAPLSAYARGSAEQLVARMPYIEAVMQGTAPFVRERRP